MEQNIYSFSATDISGEIVSLAKYQNKILLIVNTASNCGFTKQYAGLQALYEKYKTNNFDILAFPCNQFANQEPGDEHQISNFCKSNYGVTFKIFQKIDVNAENAHPLFKYLQKAAPGLLGTHFIKWNFTKFLISKAGIPVKRYSPSTIPEKIEQDIIKLL